MMLQIDCQRHEGSIFCGENQLSRILNRASPTNANGLSEYGHGIAAGIRPERVLSGQHRYGRLP